MAKLQHEIRKATPFDCQEQEAYLNLIRTAEALRRWVEDLFKRHRVSGTQYNALRILRGHADAGATCSQISDELISHDPDVTRLLDRMEKRGLIRRQREQRDRRVVRSWITDEGLRILEQLDKPVLDLHRRHLGHLGNDKLCALIALLEDARHAASREETRIAAIATKE